jgi:thiamine biosynthesis lipoprotein ApbE
MTSMTRREAHAAYAAGCGLAVADWPALGTSAQVVVTEPGRLAVASEATRQLLSEMDLAASRFRADSELARLNCADGAWVHVSPLFARALRVAIDAAEWTEGLVDPTVGAALIDRGYDRTFSLLAPTGPVSVGIREVPGWRTIELDRDRRARVRRGTLVDLGATAKALAADLCAAEAVSAAECGVLVNLGGDISMEGPPPDRGWAVTVTDLSDLSRSWGEGQSQTVRVFTGGLATSSTRARRWRRGGSEVHHLIDPRSGAPAAGPWRTVSVAATTCTLANTASTAAIIAGPDAVGWLGERGFAARLVRSDGAVCGVGGWPAGPRDGDDR